MKLEYMTFDTREAAERYAFANDLAVWAHQSNVGWTLVFFHEPSQTMAVVLTNGCAALLPDW